MRMPIVGLCMSFARRCLSGTRLILSGSLGPKALSGGISTVWGLLSFMVSRFSSMVLSIHPSPMTMSFGS